MHGRPCELALQFPLIRTHLGSMDEAVDKPWAELTRWGREAPRGSKDTRFHMNDAVFAVSLTLGANYVIAGDKEGHL